MSMSALMMPLGEWLFARRTRWPTSWAMTALSGIENNFGAAGIAAMRSQKMDARPLGEVRLAEHTVFDTVR